MESQEKKDRFLGVMSDLRDELGEEEVTRFSREIRGRLLLGDEIENMEPEMIGKALQNLDLTAPLLKLMIKVNSEDENLRNRFFHDENDPRTPREKGREVILRTIIKILEEGVTPDEVFIKDIIEKVVNQEPPPPRIQALLEEVKRQKQEK